MTVGYQFAGQMFTHALNVLKGWPQPWAIDIQGTLDAAVNIGSIATPPVSGLVVHTSALAAASGSNSPATGPMAATFAMGANLNQVPLWLWPNYTDFDVSNPGVPAGIPLGGQAGTPPAWVPIQPNGVMMALVGLANVEIETTEFDTTQTYLPNDYLRAVTSNTDANAGRVTNQNASGGQGFGSPGKNTVYTDSIVGRVSRGSYTNASGIPALALWTESIPGTR